MYNYYDQSYVHSIMTKENQNNYYRHRTCFICISHGTNLEEFEGENFRRPPKLDEDESWQSEKFIELIYLQIESDYAPNLKSIRLRVHLYNVVMLD